VKKLGQPHIALGGGIVKNSGEFIGDEGSG